MGEIKLMQTSIAKKLQLENDKKTKALVKDIVEAKNELFAATQNFNFADCDDLVDFYAHKILAAELKYNMLVKKAKEEGISYNPYLHL
ncbi:MAG: DUF2508 family protein [Eubacteriales bacterium]|jgi:hypothetical protein|nr:DUF2508 family protein [Eubacteriales bacterium]